MKHLHKIASGIETMPTMLAIWRQPELWNRHPERLAADATPHAGSSDIWLRYRAREELTHPAAFSEPHVPVFYPEWHLLPTLRPIVFNLMAFCSAVQLGGVMITKIPPGGVILPHDDRGSWHAEFFTTKIYVPLWSNEDCINFCGDDDAVMKAGDAWTFDNLVTHSVENRGGDERVTLIVCLRCES